MNRRSISHYQAQQAGPTTYSLAEGPVWDHRNERLLWVDIHHGNVHTGQLHDGRIVPADTIHVDSTVGAVALADDGSLLVAGAQEVVQLIDGRRHEVARLVPSGQHRRLNDGKCDPAGRFLVGTLTLGSPGPETLFQIDGDARVRVIDDDLAMSNGLGWSPDGSVLYSVDTGNHVVWRRPYDVRRGTWDPRQHFLTVADGSPDGLTVDRNGGIWLAVWGTGEVRRFAPDGQQIATVHVDAPYVSCPTLAGPDLDQLIITTAIDDLDERQRRDQPGSGALHTIRVGVAGLPSTPWRPSSPPKTGPRNTAKEST